MKIPNRIHFGSKGTDVQAVFEQSVMLRPLRRTFQVEESDSSYIVTWRHFSATILFAIFALVILSPVCFLGMFVGKIEATTLFILIFVWWLWFRIFGSLLNALFGKTRFVLDSEGLTATWTCLLFKQNIRIDINDIDYFKREDYPRRWKHERKQRNWVTRIRVVCNKGYFDYVVPISIVNVSAQKELDDICVQLNAFIEHFKPQPVG